MNLTNYVCARLLFKNLYWWQTVLCINLLNILMYMIYIYTFVIILVFIIFQGYNLGTIGACGLFQMRLTKNFNYILIHIIIYI